MKTITIMPCLDMKEGRVVKGVNFINIKDAGDPVENAVYYQHEGADELAMLDIAATVENRKTRLEWVKKEKEDRSSVGGLRSEEKDVAVHYDKVRLAQGLLHFIPSPNDFLTVQSDLSDN